MRRLHRNQFLKNHPVLLLFFAIYDSEFRKGVWGITLFSPEKGFPQKDCPGKANFHAHLQKTGKKRQLPFMEAAGKAVMLFSFNHLFYSDGEALHLCVGLHVKSNYSYKVSACL